MRGKGMPVFSSRLYLSPCQKADNPEWVDLRTKVYLSRLEALDWRPSTHLLSFFGFSLMHDDGSESMLKLVWVATVIPSVIHPLAFDMSPWMDALEGAKPPPPVEAPLISPIKTKVLFWMINYEQTSCSLSAFFLTFLGFGFEFWFFTCFMAGVNNEDNWWHWTGKDLKGPEP